MGTRKLKAIELILDWNLWPRHEANSLDTANIRGMRQALQAGVELPPPIVNVSDYRVIDGFHRVRAHLLEFGDDVKMKVDLRVYETDADMFQDAVKYNAQHGLPLSPKDRAHAIIKARAFKIPLSAIAMALGMTEASTKTFLEQRSAKKQSGETVALSYGAKNLAGKILTDEQVYFNDHVDGNVPIMHATMLLNALRADAMEMSVNACSRLRELHKEIGRVIKERCHG